MKTPRRSFSMIALPHAVFAIGGYDGKVCIKSVEMFEYDSNRWVEVAPL